MARPRTLTGPAAERERKAALARYHANKATWNGRNKDYRGRVVQSQRTGGELELKGQSTRRSEQSFFDKLGLINEHKRTHPCLNCGEADPVVLDLHHRDPSTKLFTLGNNTHIKRHSLAAISTEIAKCDVLCANCHRRLHAGQITLLR